MAIMKTLTINGTTYTVSSVVPALSVTLLADQWVSEEGRYYQMVTVAGVTPRSKVDLQPTPEQLVEFHHKVLGFTTVNNGGEVKVIAVGDKPRSDHTIQVTLTEVEGTGEVMGDTVGTTMPRANLQQDDPNMADYVLGKDAFLEATKEIAISTEEPTDENVKIWIDTDEEAPEAGSGIDVTAEVGQTIVVEEVDASGKPTTWKAADYQPRTHWAEVEELLNETPTYMAEDGMFVYSSCPTLTGGETYIFTYNGTRYYCEAVDCGEGMIVLGNMAITDSELPNTGEPFFFGTQDGMAVTLDATGATEINVKITKEQYNTIPAEYVPSYVVTVLSEHMLGTSSTIAQIRCDTTELVKALRCNAPIYIDISNIKDTSARLRVIYWETLGIKLSGFPENAAMLTLYAYMPGINKSSNENFLVQINMAD